MLDHVVLAQEGAHAVAEQEQWLAGLFLCRLSAHAVQCIQRVIPAVMIGEVAEFGGTIHTAPVPGPIQRIDGPAGGIEHLRQALVARAMFGHAVRHQQGGAGRPLRQPAMHVDGAAIGLLQLESVVTHG